MTRKGIKLVAPDMNGVICYQGNCKVIIDTLSKMLKIEPYNKDYPDISVMFEWKWKFIQNKNILFVFAVNAFQDFVLVFSNDEICKTVHNKIYKNREEDFIEKKELQQRLLIPIFQKMSNTSTRFKKVMFEWIEKHEENEKKELLKLLKVHENKYQILDVKNIKQELNTGGVRKRRFSEIGYAGQNEEENIASKNKSNAARSKNKKQIISPEVKIIEESKFKIVNFKYQSGLYRKLLIFTSSEKTHCYEYNFHLSKQIFYHTCNNYQNGMKAILKVDENGNDCIEYENKKHVCSPLNYDPKKYIELKIVKKPNYEIMENCSSKSKLLFIFDSNDRNFCYEYYWSSKNKNFRCCGCQVKKKNITAGIVHENTEFEYIMLLKDGHVCDKRDYNPQKFNQIKKFVLSPNFEIQLKIKNGIERKSLIIFEGNNRQLCYTYYFQHSANRYFCNGCSGKHVHVFAKLCQNDDGEEYVILSNVKHLCSPKEYIPQHNQIILRPPQIKFMESNEKYTSKLFIFDLNNPNLCYIFSKRYESNSREYYCLGCKKSTNKMAQLRKNVFVSLYKDDDSLNDGEYYVKMVDGQTHICEPQKYEPEKYEVKILKPKDDYILFQTKEKKKDSLCLAVYHPENKSLCYSYYYQSGIKQFRCKECEKKKIQINAKIFQNSDGYEYIIPHQKKHVCKPIKVSSIIKPNTVILEKSGLTFEKSKNDVDESRIIRLPNFELQRNIKGVPDRKLVIFKSDDKNICFEYGYDYDQFRCNKCRITAKLHSENDEKYVILGENEHRCEPVKYEDEKTKTIKSCDFMIFNRDDNSKPTKLIIFTSLTKDLCYEYTFNRQSKNFRCVGCSAVRKILSAKSLVNDNGEEFIQLLSTDHLCTPKKFVLEEFQPKIIPKSGFIICSNKNGRLNSKLIIFDSKKDGFGYEYCLDGKNLFKCIKCQKLKKRVTAKLCKKENGEKYLELSVKKHACESTKYEYNKIIFDNFVFQHNTAGDPNSRLTTFDKNDKNLGYQYSFHKSRNVFVCCECTKRSKPTTAKLLIDANGKQTVEFGKNEHGCEIQNFKEKGIIFNDFTFENNGNILITNDSKKKFYKFEYDEKIGGFCCIKCKEEKKKIITATVCNGNDGKEFILLNHKHFCTALSK